MLKLVEIKARKADLRVVQDLIEEHEDEIKLAWQKHFGG